MRYALLLTLLFLPSLGHTSPAEEREEFRIPILDKVQEIFGSRINFAANRLDSFFATDRADDELGRSRIRIRSQFEIREHFKSDQTNQYRINLKLPHLEEKFRYDYYQKKPNETITPSEKEKVKDLNRINKGWIFNADLGVSAAIPPKVTTRARLRRNFEMGSFIHRFVEQLTYVTDQRGLIQDTYVYTDYSFSETLLFRFINSVTWQIINKDFNTQHGPTLLQQVTDNDAFNYSAFLYSEIVNGSWFSTNYQASIDYRRNLYRQWLYLDLRPGIDFPKTLNFNGNPFFFMQLEILLGH